MDENTTRSTEMTSSVRQRVERIIEKIRPIIRADGGDVELIDVTDDAIARIRFHGACTTCPSRQITLKSGIEQNVIEHVPEIRGVEQVK